MEEQFKKAIEENYSFKITSCRPAARGAIAETFIINDTYFCKIVRKPLIIDYLAGSLPLADALANSGIDRINRLVKPRNGLSIAVDDAVVILSACVPGTQGRDFDMAAFGKLLARIHGVKTNIKTPCEDFGTGFTDIFAKIFTEPAHGVAGEALKKVFQTHGDDLQRHLDVFRRVADICAGEKSAFSITHGDVQGNVMMREKDDLYIIDWDEAILAPRERDLWFFQDFPDFAKGYGTDYEINPRMLDFYILKSYFINTLLRVDDILRTGNSDEKRKDSLEKLEWRISPKGWMRPKLDGVKI